MRRGALLGLLALLAACRTAAPPPPPAPPPAPRPHTSGIARRAVVMSFDGLSADQAGAFGLLDDMPLRVRRVIPVDPTQTSSTHTAILTGETPAKSGIVGNNYHRPGTPRTEVTRGLDAETEAETLLDVAKRNGKRVGALIFPTIDAATPRRTPDFGLRYSRNLTEPRVVQLRRADFHAEWLPPTWGTPAGRHPSYSAPMRARLEWRLPQKAEQDVDLVAYDSTDDGARNYDAFFVESSAGEQPLEGARWFAISQRLDDGLYGSWSKLLKADPALDNVAVYWGPINHNDAYPQSFRQLVDEEAGFWPGVPDETSARSGAIDHAAFTEQMERFSDYLNRAAGAAIAHEQFDLLLAYQPVIDQVAHPFLSDAAMVRAAYAAMSRAVAATSGRLDPTRDALVVLGDHGLAPFDTVVRVTRLLADNGLADRWEAFASGGSIAHFYRFGDPDDAAHLVDVLTSLKAPDGAPVFERVERKTAAMHPNSGDVIAFAYPRFALAVGTGDLFRSAAGGQHGGLNVHREYHTTLGARGAGIAPETIDELPQTEIAPFVRRLLGWH
ncbi:MAG TPA: alkaline phosphatase family protein [Thermoanaerobaculia bacterium]|nr:alkaline phosphatase family protein [Thermoanaerobaculia bacterium]